MSLPARGVWIEIVHWFVWLVIKESLPARGVWIEIIVTVNDFDLTFNGHSPHGECGLKFYLLENPLWYPLVTPRTGSVD